MALVRFANLVVDAVDVAAQSPVWARWLHLEQSTDDPEELSGDQPEQTVWLEQVPEPKTVKNRVHLDLIAADLTPFADATPVPSAESLPWTTFTDAEGNEFCVFVDAERTPGLKDVVVDAVDHRSIGAWWADVWGGVLASNDEYTWLDEIPGAPVESFDFVPVPEPKTVKNRVHWDVRLLDGVTLDDLVARGATLILPPGDDRTWTVMADPEGNEFCVLAAPASSVVN